MQRQVQFGKEKLHHVKAEYDNIKVVASQAEKMVAMLLFRVSFYQI
jgi:hypothetical protein